MNNKKAKFIIVAIIILLIVCGVTAGVYCFKYFEARKYHATGEENKSQANDNTVTYEGKEYVYNYNLKNILFLGIDNEAEIELENRPGMGGQADCIMILSMNSEDKTSTILQISRDSMTEIDIYDTQGNHYTSISAQLAAQYAYGNTATTSCWATKNTVSELLYNLPIYGYISLDIAGIPLINEYVGGVTLTMPEDYTDVDPTFTKGNTITLDGEQAERYVRYRDTNKKGSNQVRMERQVHYIPALKDKLVESLDDSEEDVEELTSIIEPYLVTDLTTEEIAQLAEYEWEVENVTYVPGEVMVGEEHEEFHINEAELQKLIIDTFYQLKN